jgi:DNA-binding beta-propeller fold protein YncE
MLLTALLAGAFALGCQTRTSNDAAAFSRIVGTQGRQPGQFSKPRAVAMTGANDLIVIDRTGRIQRLDFETGEVRAKWLLPRYDNGTPTGMTLGPGDVTLWIADTHYQRILQYDLDGKLLFSFGEEGTEPGQMIFPTDVCPDPLDGSLWVCEYGLRSRVMHFSSTGEFINEWGSGEYAYADLQRPMAISVDAQGRVFVVDGGNHRVLAYSRQGELLFSWGEAGEAPGKLKYPYDMAFAPDGTVYICEYGNSRVSHFTAEGEFLGFWGTPGYKAGELFSPWGVAVDSEGRVAVADTNNGRVQIIERPRRAFTGGGDAT